jgi:probable HAF family extracellular repeat protein
MTPLPALGGSSCAFDISDNGHIVGQATTGAPQSGFHAARWLEDQITDLGDLGGYQNSMAWGVNNAGQAVGWGGAAAIVKPFVHDFDTGLRDLRDLLPADTGWFWLQPRDINESGQIVGSGIRDLYHGFLMTPVDADFDDDGDTDLADLAAFQRCYTGPNRPIPEVCLEFDIDSNGQINLQDFHTLHLAFTGPQ